MTVPQSVAFLCLWTALAVLMCRLYDIDQLIQPHPELCDRDRAAGPVYAALVLLAIQVLRFHIPGSR